MYLHWGGKLKLLDRSNVSGIKTEAAKVAPKTEYVFQPRGCNFHSPLPSQVTNTMYTKSDFDSIKNSLKNLSVEELNTLRSHIDLWISKKNTTSSSVSVQLLNSENERYLEIDPPSKPITTLLEIDPPSKPITTLNVNPRKISNLKSFYSLLQQPDSIESIETEPRPSGVWRGQVEIADDFNELSNDILSDFGLD